MTSVLIMAWKDLKLMRRDWLGMFFILGFPIGLGLFFGFIFGSAGAQSNPIEVGVVDEDQSEMSQKFVQLLVDDDLVAVRPLGRSEALDEVRRGRLTGFIALPEGFGETAGLFWMDPPTVEVGVDPSRRAEAGMLEGLVHKGLGQLMGARFEDPGSMRPMIREAMGEMGGEDVPPALQPLLAALYGSLDEFLDRLDDVQRQQGGDAAVDAPQLNMARLVHVDVTRHAEPGSEAETLAKVRSQWDISFPQATLWGILACAATFAATMVRENVTGTLLRLQIAPVRRGSILAGKALACFFAVIGVTLVMTILGIWLGMRPESYARLAAAVVAIAYCFSGIMMVMSVVGRTEEAVAGAAWGANMVMAMFGGGMLPLAFMPPFMQTLSHFSPVKWAILSMEGAIWRGFSWQEMVAPCSVLLLVGTAALALGAAILSRRCSQ